MKIVIVSRSQSQLDEIRAGLAAGGSSDTVSTLLGELAQLQPAIWSSGADAAVLDGYCSGPSELDVLESMLHRPGAPAVVLVCKNPTAEMLLAVMRTGVREVLPSPADPKALREALARAMGRNGPGVSTPSKGQVLVFVSCKGGAGATFLATNLGYALAESRPVKVALLDLNLQAGDAALHVSDRVPATTLSDVVRNIGRLDGSYLAASMIPVLPNFGVLAAPGAPERALEIQPDHIDALLDVAVLHYDYVIIDASRVLDAAVVRALDRADTIYAVLQLTVPFVRDAKRLLGTFESLGYPRSRIQLIVNRHERGGELDVKDAERALDLPVAWAIPNSFRAVTSSVNQGIPILKLLPKDPVARILQTMAAAVVRPRKKGENWVRELLHLN